MRLSVLNFAALFALLAPKALGWSQFVDCDATADVKEGPFGAPAFKSEVVNETTVYSLLPEVSNLKLPLVAFMHGSTGQYGFYNDSLALIASHGAIVVFPFVKSPEKDKSPFTTNTDGKFLVKAIEWAKQANEDPGSHLYGRVDTDKIIVAGHSMGATCTINAAHTLKSDPSTILAFAMHPGICGPFGPPPCPACWRSETLLEVAKEMPVFMTTATNDGAFWPAPLTAKHEFGCFKKAFGEPDEPVADDEIQNTAFVQFNEDVCEEDGEREPLVKDGGHNCPMKRVDGGAPEMSVLLKAVKLYGQQGGKTSSKCFDLLYGDNDVEGSLQALNVTDYLDTRIKA